MKPAWIILFAVAAAVAQTQPTFRSTTRLVQVNVVVNMKKGQPVTDLKREDFTLLEQGKPRPIAFFSLQVASKLSQPAVALPENVFSNSFGDRKDVPQSVTVILLDSLNTPWQDQVVARNHVIRFLKQIPPHERVALYTMGRGFRVLHDYTSDTSSLLERLNMWTAKHEPELQASQTLKEQGDPLADLMSDEMHEADQRIADFVAETRIVSTLRTLESVAHHLAAVPGRKSLIWVSGGFPLTIGFESMEQVMSGRQWRRTFSEEMQRTLRAFNHANVAIYPVDARGLMTDPTFGADRRGSNMRAGGPNWSPPNQGSLQELADRTGGKAYYNRNDIDGAVGEVFADAQVTYTLGFYPEDEDRKGTFRDIRVKVNRPGVSLRYRNGYFALTEAASDSKSIDAEMSSAVWSPLDATAVGVNARVDLFKKENEYRIITQIDPGTISLKQVGDRWQGRLDMAFVQKDAPGRRLGGVTETLTLNLTKERYLQILQEGMLYTRTLPFLADGRQLRIVVRDAPSGLAGSITVPLSKVVSNEGGQ